MNGHPRRYVLGSVFVGTAHGAQYRALSVLFCGRVLRCGVVCVGNVILAHC